MNDNYYQSILGKEEDARVLAEKTNSTNPLCGDEDYGISCRCWNSHHTQLDGQSWKETCNSEKATNLRIFKETYACAAAGYLYTPEAFREGDEYNSTGKEVEKSSTRFLPSKISMWDDVSHYTAIDQLLLPECYEPCQTALDEQIDSSRTNATLTFCEEYDFPCKCTNEEQGNILAQCLRSSCRPNSTDVETVLWWYTLQCAEFGVLFNRSPFIAVMEPQVDVETSGAVKSTAGLAIFAVSAAGTLVAML